MKEYGKDLEIEHKKIKNKLISIENKIKKRLLFIIDKNPNFIIENKQNEDNNKISRFKGIINSMSIEFILEIIKFVEKDYIAKSKQLKIFE